MRRRGTRDQPRIVGRTEPDPKYVNKKMEVLVIPCQQCTGCRLENARQKSIRVVHEAAYLWEEYGQPSSFITLTYDDYHLPRAGSLVKHHFQDFMKRLRSRIDYHTNKEIKIKHFSCGEYGEQTGRPHYHSIILGWNFPDRMPAGCREGEPVFTSALLEECWEYGMSEIGTVTWDSASYVAGYVIKKQTGKAIDAGYYTRHCALTDQIIDIEPDFGLMSNGIGLGYLGKYYDQMYPSDECTIPGRGTYGTPPKYYDKHAENWGADMDKIKKKRREAQIEALTTGPSVLSKAIIQDARLKRKQEYI